MLGGCAWQSWLALGLANGRVQVFREAAVPYQERVGSPMVVGFGGILAFIAVRFDQIHANAYRAFALVDEHAQIVLDFNLLYDLGDALIQLQFHRVESVRRFDPDIHTAPARREFGRGGQSIRY